MSLRKICVVVASRANYGRVKSLLVAIKDHPKLELQIVVGASALIDRYGGVWRVIENDGFHISRKLFYSVDGENLQTQVKSTGLGMIELATAFVDLTPDIVVTVADRFETLATAAAAAYMNIPLAHIQGGEISGNIDDKVRHAITKLADIHFPATKKSADRLKEMGESSESIFNFGCPAMDLITKDRLKIDAKIMSKYGGVGPHFDWTLPYLFIVQHPVTTSFGRGREQIDNTLRAAAKFSGTHHIVVLWPNADAGSEDVAKGMRVFREAGEGREFSFFRNFTPEDFLRVLANSACAVGNSSSFLREGEFLNVPAVLVGDRQIGREIYGNCIISGYHSSEIIAAVEDRLKFREVYEGVSKGSAYGDGSAGRKICNVLASYRIGGIKRLSIS
jgi:UDP-hydrolysing UDP-N-acetyl-D-glucosamine 2-epimerase